MVDANAHGGVVLLTDIDEGHELRLYLLQFGSVLLVGVLQMLERAARVDVVAGVDAHLLAVLGSDVGSMCGEMDVGH